MILTLTSCSGTYRAYYQTLKLAFADLPKVEISLEKVLHSEVDLASIRRGSRPEAILALAYLEDKRHKWVSADNAMLIMEKGRIVRTLGLGENLLFLSNTAQDPLKNFPISHNILWSRIADWTGDEYGYGTESYFLGDNHETINELSIEIDTVKYVEQVTYTAPSEYVQLHKSWQNIFWFDKKNGILVKSIQTLSPLSEPIELVYLSRIARLQVNNTK
jgi:hypothetical protein